MDIEKIAQFIAETTALPGVPGYEAGVNGRIADWFRPYAREVFTDNMENLYALVGKDAARKGPRVIVCAHQDEIGLVVCKIEKDGCLRIFKNGGVDPRILPGMEVSVQTASGPLYGVIGAKPPHLLTEKDREKALKLDDLYVDVGLDAEEARLSFLLGNRAILERFRALRTQIDYGLFLVAQHAAIAALNGPQEGVARQRAEYQRRRDALCHGLTAAGWNVPDAKGTMFVWAKTPRGWEDDETFVTELFKRTGVLCTPGSAFASLGQGHVRFALVRPVEDLTACVERIAGSGML